jgi:hypothetical protein
MHAAGCTRGTRAGGLSRPRRRPPAMFSAPLSGLWHEGVGPTLARRPSGPKRRRARAVSTRPQSHAPTPAGNKVDQAPTGAHRSVAGERCRGRGKLPARASHVPPAPGARIPRTSRSRRAHPTYLPLPARASPVPPAPGARIPRTSRSRRAHPTYLPLPARASHVPPAPGARIPRTSFAARTSRQRTVGCRLDDGVNPQTRQAVVDNGASAPRGMASASEVGLGTNTRSTARGGLGDSGNSSSTEP